MFTVEQRNRIRDELVTMAETDESIVGAAFVGSTATGEQDAWSDIDLMLQLSPMADEAEVVDRWTKHLYTNYAGVHHLDVMASGGVRYRVFLTSDSLQMDISFWPHDAFRAKGDRFRLLFGSPNAPEPPAADDVDALIGQSWLFAIHVRAALARKQRWFALSLMDTLRDRIVMLASIRLGLNPHQRREVDQLPTEFLMELEQARAASLHADELDRSFSALMRMYQREITAYDAALSDRLAAPITTIVNSD